MFYLCAGGVLYAALVILALHGFRTELSPLSNPISLYAIGPYGRWMTSALWVWCCASLALAAGIYPTVERSVYIVAGVGLLIVFSLGLAVAACLHMDPSFPPKRFHPSEFSTRGLLHISGATLSTVSFPIAALLLSAGLAADPRWQHLTVVAYGLAALSVVTTAAFFVISRLKVQLFGVAQRSFVAADLVWMFTVSTALLVT